MLQERPEMAVTIWHIINTIKFLPYSKERVLSLQRVVRDLYPIDSNRLTLAKEEITVDQIKLGRLIYIVLGLLRRSIGSHYASTDSSSKALSRRLLKVSVSISCGE